MNSQKLETILLPFNKIKLAVQKTPIQELRNFGEFIGVNNLYIKRDDMNGLGAGGNKVRNLEYLLGDALKKGSDLIISSGDIESNLCTLTAAACRKLGLDCILVHNNYYQEQLKGNMILNKILGIKQIYLGDVGEDIRGVHVEELSKDYEKKGRKPYIIYNGGTTPLGSLGYVEGALEIYKQIKEMNINITNIFVPGGNGGLAAGMIYGAAALDIPFHINVISVEHCKNDLSNIIYSLVEGIEELVGLKLKHRLEDVMTIDDNYRGEGWNRSTNESVDVIYDLARKEGIFLEKVYTSKAFLGMKTLLESKRILCKGACFLHSGGFSSLFGQF